MAKNVPASISSLPGPNDVQGYPGADGQPRERGQTAAPGGATPMANVDAQYAGFGPIPTIPTIRVPAQDSTATDAVSSTTIAGFVDDAYADALAAKGRATRIG